MKVLMITDNLKGGGAERRLIECMKGLVNLGVEIRLISLNTENAYPKIDQLNIRIYRIKRIMKKDPLVIFRIMKICWDFRPAIIHTWGSMSSIYAVPICLMMRIRLVNAMITNAVCKKYSWRWRRARLTFPFSDIVLSNSQAGLDAYDAPAEKSFVVYNGFSFSRTNNLLPRHEILKKFNIKSGFVVGMVGFVDYRKDHYTLVKSARKIYEMNRDVTFLCVGDGILLSEMKSISSDLPNVIFTGRQSAVEAIIQTFDIGILTTNTNRHYEGISNSILEYMAMGVPVIATDGGGTNEIVVDGETGYIIPPDSEEKLTEKILFLMDNADLRHQFGINSLNRIRESFNYESMINKTYSMYQRALQN